MNPNSARTAILIDDDELFALAWGMSAKKMGIKFHYYSTKEAFLKNVDSFDRTAVLYVDWYINGAETSENFLHELHQMGFSEIHIASSLPNIDITSMPWIRSVQDKHPPWLNQQVKNKS